MQTIHAVVNTKTLSSFHHLVICHSTSSCISAKVSFRNSAGLQSVYSHIQYSLIPGLESNDKHNDAINNSIL